MKIHFDNVNFQSRTGPNTFADRLAKVLFVSGHQVQLEANGADVSLVFIERSGKPLAPKVVQRLDGIWFRPQDFEIKNRNIKALYDHAHAVIFQSEFDKAMVESWWGSNEALNRPCAVIGNGIELAPVKELTIPILLQMRNRYERIYVCSSNWHPQKRLAANVKLFNHLRRSSPDQCLIIMGNHPDHSVADPHVFYTGHVDPEVYMQVYAAADWMLHLAWADHCPNVVVEALSQGTPVACSEVGGTKELIGNGAYGLVLKENEPYDYRPYDYDNPPDVDVHQVTSLPSRHSLDYAGIPSIDITCIADRYVRLFERLCTA